MSRNANSLAKASMTTTLYLPANWSVKWPIGNMRPSIFTSSRHPSLSATEVSPVWATRPTHRQ